MQEAIGIGLFVTAALLGAVGLGYQLGCYAMAEEALRYKRLLVDEIRANQRLHKHFQEEAK